MRRNLILAILGTACAFALRWPAITDTKNAHFLQIKIAEIDKHHPAIAFSIPAGRTQYDLLPALGRAIPYRAYSNNERVLRASADGNVLTLTGVAPGRAGLRIEAAGLTRYVGVQVVGSRANGKGFPNYTPVGFASEDTAEHLQYWKSFSPADKRYTDIRYLYLNGGPHEGWQTWGDREGSRVVHFIRNSRMLGMIPFFVWYNLPEKHEDQRVALTHLRSLSYMRSYFRSLDLALRLIRRESEGDLVGMVLEPDFLGYLAQHGGSPGAWPAATRAVYQEGLLSRSRDPHFPDTVRGFVECMNYLISKRTPNVQFGWHVNHWASPAGGWTTPIRPRGVLHNTREHGIEAGRGQISREASAIAAFYTRAGALTHGARFLALDKYGLDAAAAEPHAARSPATSTWFWNSDIWGNYLTFVKALHQRTGLPVLLWQLPAGHINGSLQETANTGETDLPNTPGSFEDSAAPYFFGDTFRASGARREWFATNSTRDGGVSLQGEQIEWQSHMRQAAESGVLAVLFGPGVPGATTAIGANPGDNSWLMTKVQRYLDDASSPETVARLR